MTFQNQIRNSIFQIFQLNCSVIFYKRKVRETTITIYLPQTLSFCLTILWQLQRQPNRFLTVNLFNIPIFRETFWYNFKKQLSFSLSIISGNPFIKSYADLKIQVLLINHSFKLFMNLKKNKNGFRNNINWSYHISYHYFAFCDDCNIW